MISVEHGTVVFCLRVLGEFTNGFYRSERNPGRLQSREQVTGGEALHHLADGIEPGAEILLIALLESRLLVGVHPLEELDRSLIVDPGIDGSERGEECADKHGSRLLHSGR